jgi:arginase
VRRWGSRATSGAQLQSCCPRGSKSDSRAAVDAVRRHTSSLVVHLDVDAVDSRDLSLASYPHYGTGIPLASAGDVLAELCGVSTLAAIVLTEVKPSYDPTGRQLARYIDTVAAAIGHGLRR